ncbi:hypothetical protein [Paraburkholderia sp. Ac-20340]|uniref:hypothetical protein n=1 Tax=Paraburkholderia sp. Ac-20340 TaxID=2703888 RepID=UPI001F11CC4E|nr:hypothetical protein [Paraburkholderia sp. Ac-20340]
MLTSYIGATFQLIGGLQKDGAEGDFTGYALTANLYDGTGTNLISALVVNWLDVTKGLLTLTSPSDTSQWPACKARIDCKLIAPAGEIILGPPVYVRLEQSPLS